MNEQARAVFQFPANELKLTGAKNTFSFLSGTRYFSGRFPFTSESKFLLFLAEAFINVRICQMFIWGVRKKTHEAMNWNEIEQKILSLRYQELGIFSGRFPFTSESKFLLSFWQKPFYSLSRVRPRPTDGAVIDFHPSSGKAKASKPRWVESREHPQTLLASTEMPKQARETLKDSQSQRERKATLHISEQLSDWVGQKRALKNKLIKEYWNKKNCCQSHWCLVFLVTFLLRNLYFAIKFSSNWKTLTLRKEKKKLFSRARRLFSNFSNEKYEREGKRMTFFPSSSQFDVIQLLKVLFICQVVGVRRRRLYRTGASGPGLDRERERV